MKARKKRETPNWKQFFPLKKKTAFSRVSLFIFGCLSYVMPLVYALKTALSILMFGLCQYIKSWGRGNWPKDPPHCKAWLPLLLKYWNIKWIRVHRPIAPPVPTALQKADFLQSLGHTHSKQNCYSPVRWIWLAYSESVVAWLRLLLKY